MHRRAFLQTAAASLAWTALPRSARAQACVAASTPFLVVVEAQGAWDPTYLCDPQDDAKDTFTFYDAAHVGTTDTGLRYAPFDVVANVPAYYQVGGVDFFQKYKSDLLVVNGVDTQTVSHEVGPRHTFSGHLREGHPAISGLVAAARGATLPMALISSGGYDSTAGLVPVTRAGSVSALQNLARPYKSSTSPASTTRYLDDATATMISTAQTARDARLRASLGLRRRTAALDALGRARASEPAFVSLAEALDAVTPVDGATNAALPFAQVALTAMSAGVCAAAHISVGSFDTHDLHDSLDAADGHRPKMQQLLDVIDYVVQSARADPTLAARGVIVVVGSDFARTAFNSTDPVTRGKDHWPVTSMMILGVGGAAPLVQGGRTIGETVVMDENGAPHPGARAKKLKVEGGALVPTADDDPSGIALKPAHVHQALREALGLCTAEDAALLAKYPLLDVPATPLPILTTT